MTLELNLLIELQERYAKCPVCKSNHTRDGVMAATSNRFQRACKCGFSVDVFVNGDTQLIVEGITEPISDQIASVLSNINGSSILH